MIAKANPMMASTMKITEALLAEHVVFHNLFDHVERAVPGLKTLAEVHSLATLLDALLTAHSEVEEELLIAPLEHCFEQIGQRETFHQEHHDIETNLAAAQRAKVLKRARQCLLAAVLSARKHFDKEERIVFPMAEEVLSSRTMAALSRKWLEKRKALLG